MRSQRGIQLIEMVVAVGLSGVFVVLLTGMLAQTLALSVSSENQILAGAIADQYCEWAQAGRFINSSTTVTIDFPLQQASPSGVLPSGLQQLAVSEESYGTYNNGAMWQTNTGNQFKGQVIVSPYPGAKIPNSTNYLIQVKYSANGNMRTVNRTASYLGYSP